jgi:hypothetical protein
MTGQLWQPCPRCDAEPVCVDCERCARHCRCTDDAAQRQAFERAYPGLLQQIAQHHAQGAQEQ